MLLKFRIDGVLLSFLNLLYFWIVSHTQREHEILAFSVYSLYPLDLIYKITSWRFSFTLLSKNETGGVLKHPLLVTILVDKVVTTFLRTLQRNCCTISWFQWSRVVDEFLKVRNLATWAIKNGKRQRKHPRTPWQHLGCNAFCIKCGWTWKLLTNSTCNFFPLLYAYFASLFFLKISRNKMRAESFDLFHFSRMARCKDH